MRREVSPVVGLCLKFTFEEITRHCLPIKPSLLGTRTLVGEPGVYSFRVWVRLCVEWTVQKDEVYWENEDIKGTRNRQGCKGSSWSESQTPYLSDKLK